MNSLQIAPVSGFKSPSVLTASSVGEASSAPADTARQATPAPAQTSAASQTSAPNAADHSVNQQLASARADAARAAEDRAAKEKADARKAANADDQKAYDLKIGVQPGGDHVTIDIVDPTLHRTIFRVFGPPDKTGDGGDQSKDTADKNAEV